MTWEGHADKIKVPYLCVAGEFDELSPIEHSERLVKAVQGAEADGGLSGIAPLGRQRAGGQSRAVPADPGRRLARRPRRRQAVPERALVRALATARSTRSRFERAGGRVRSPSDRRRPFTCATAWATSEEARDATQYRPHLDHACRQHPARRGARRHAPRPGTGQGGRPGQARCARGCARRPRAGERGGGRHRQRQ